ncbi:uncharacterized protein [Drosophila bipectinata]|uniref:uncharacterized protein isoform X2 n=1 Tax=Drosophila bipectinata TaxID=42026 RepID=UPI001C8ACAE4|nr:uncharacterized protein LOC108126406 isoform X2 [Drosophila bipectinata]
MSSEDSIGTFERDAEEAIRSYKDIRRLLMESMRVLGGGPVTKNGLLRMLSMTTGQHPTALAQNVDDIIEELVSRGKWLKRGNNYSMKKRRA